jgi:hypothetical protein
MADSESYDSDHGKRLYFLYFVIIGPLYISIYTLEYTLSFFLI